MASDTGKVPVPIKLFSASMSGVSGTLVCYPLDLLKLNMQMSGEHGAKRKHITTIDFINLIVKRDGVRGLYTGLSASVLRQFMYTGSRLGIYQVLVDKYEESGEKGRLLVKTLCGCVAGAIGGAFGVPPDVALSRMAVDRQRPLNDNRKYTHVFNALYRIRKEEGFAVLFRGFVPTVFRGIVVNISQVVGYSQSKEFLVSRTALDLNLCYFLSSVFSAVLATTVTLPPDIAKTRIQNMKIEKGVPGYGNMFDVWIACIKEEGFFSLWKGFTPLLLRNGPQFLVTFFVYEYMLLYYKKIFMK